MHRSIKEYVTITLKGMAMGAADVVPGVSGGTIAFITGIYQELITTISGVNLSLITVWREEGFKAMWYKLNGPFIIALLTGILISIFSIMRLANYLLEEHPVHIWSFFFGLILASVWFVAKQIPKWNWKLITGLILGAAVAFYIISLPPMAGTHSDWFLFFAGAIAICAMILPGISGAFILVLLGAYKPITEAVRDFDLKTILIVGVGAVAGLLSFSRILKWLFAHYTNITLAVLTGFIAGSLNKIWPWKKTLETAEFGDKVVIIKEASVLPWNFEGEPHLFPAVILMLAGLILILLLERIAIKKPIIDATENKDA
jgi:putative membrane protein